LLNFCPETICTQSQALVDGGPDVVNQLVSQLRLEKLTIGGGSLQGRIAECPIFRVR
jgi:hypothetical protein